MGGGKKPPPFTPDQRQKIDYFFFFFSTVRAYTRSFLLSFPLGDLIVRSYVQYFILSSWTGKGTLAYWCRYAFHRFRRVFGSYYYYFFPFHRIPSNRTRAQCKMVRKIVFCAGLPRTAIIFFFFAFLRRRPVDWSSARRTSLASSAALYNHNNSIAASMQERFDRFGRFFCNCQDRGLCEWIFTGKVGNSKPFFR